MTRRTLLFGASCALAQTSKKAPPGLDWPQWGGPHRNFTTEVRGIREQWPAEGPKVLWKRPLGEGYSSTIVANGVLYTMYGPPNQEIVLAADAATGKTIWEHSTPVNFKSDYPPMGSGTYSTPLLVGDRLFTTGVAGRLQCLDRKTGKPLWTQHLWDDHRGTRLLYGYSSSPLAFRDTIIVPAGGKGRAMMAFSQADGKVAWSKGDLGNAYSSPILINVGGLDQVVSLLDGALMGFNPVNGDPQWSTPFRAQFAIAVATPVFGPGDLLFVSSEYDGGAKVVELKRNGLKIDVREVWTTPRLRLHHGNVLLVGGVLYFTSGGKGSQPILSAVEMATGKIHWQERSISKANFVWADGKAIALDQDGVLMIAHPSPSGFKIAARAQLLENNAWTPPALVGTRLYMRDRKNMMAVELG
jgi:outer membrane protein assembly factor BamB